MAFNRESMKSLLVRDKGFLRELYEGPNPLKNTRVLKGASDTQLNTLIKFLHFLSNGEITMKKENFEVIEKANKLKLIKSKVEKKKQMNILLKSERKDKLKFLNKLCNIYSALLFTLFNQ
jgi:hypothetical protein